MKSKAQIVVAILFLLSFIKSFKYSGNAYDIVFILICAGIYTLYELISENKLKEQVGKLTMDTDNRFKETEKEMKDTKNYVSSISLGQTFRK